MRHIISEFSTMAVASMAMAMVVLMAGSSVPLGNPAWVIDPAHVLPSWPSVSLDDTRGCRTGELPRRADRTVQAVAVLCQHELRQLVSFRIEGLTPGTPYTIRLGFMAAGASCDEPPCVPMSLLGESQGGLTELLGEYVASPDGQLLVTVARQQVNLLAGGSSPVMLVQRSTTAGPLTEATMTFP